MEYLIKIIAKCYVLSEPEGNKIFIYDRFKPSFLFESHRYLSTVFTKNDILLGETKIVDITIIANENLKSKLKKNSSFELKSGQYTIARGIVKEIISVS